MKIITALVLSSLAFASSAVATPNRGHGRLALKVCPGKIAQAQTKRTFTPSTIILTHPFIDGTEAQEQSTGSHSLTAMKGGTIVAISMRKKGRTPLMLAATTLGGCHKVVLNWDVR